jgi:formylglycine-generating enzyme required for sulfatase activity
MVKISGGKFLMGVDAPRSRYSSPAHEVEVAPFEIDATEVTTADFEAFLRSRGELAQKAQDWPDEHPPAGERDYPVVNVTHDQAIEFAAWRGCRLPTEAELEFVARGASGRIVPPGFEGDLIPATDDWLSLHGVKSVDQDRVDTPGGPVYGLFANAGELTLLRFRPYAHSSGIRPYSSHWFGFVVRCGLVRDTENGSPRVLGYTGRASALPDQRNALVGFRCARSLRPRADLSPAALAGLTLAPGGD